MKLTRFLSLLFASLCIGCNAQDTGVKVAEPAEFRMMIERDSTALVLDVRKPEEFAEGHLKGARLMNWLDEERFKKEAATLEKSRTLYVYCRSGRRSNAAAHWLTSQGFKTVDMKGGILAWKEAALPTEKPKDETGSNASAPEAQTLQ